MKQRIPALLKPGDTIGIAATARFATPELLATAKRFIEKAGFKCYYHKDILSQKGQVAGSLGERINSFNHLIHHRDVKAIWCVRGGYGSAEIVDAVDWGALEKEPKWLIGFSDFTTFLLHAAQRGIPTMHAAMPVSFEMTKQRYIDATFEMLSEGKGSYPLSKTPPFMNGKLVGGNLSVISSIYGTPSLPSLNGCILFLEDLDEYHYHLDRMLLSLKRQGAFEGLQGVLLGTFSDIHDHSVKWGARVGSTLRKYFAELGIPAVSGFPVGHEPDNAPIIVGVHAEVDKGTLRFSL